MLLCEVSLCLLEVPFFHLFYPSLLQNSTISLVDIIPFHQMLERQPQYASFINSFLCIDIPKARSNEYQRNWQRLYSYSQLPRSLVNMDGQSQNGFQTLNQIILSKLENLQTLIVEHSIFIFTFTHKLRGKVVPLPFLSGSLKRLQLPLANRNLPALDSLSTRNAIWLLSFVPKLHQASIGMTLSLDDAKFLSEHKEAFHGLSNVKELAIKVRFVASPSSRKTWWKSAALMGKKKSEAMSDFLQVTNGLTSLELLLDQLEGNPGDETEPYISCTNQMTNSFDTLKHLRNF